LLSEKYFIPHENNHLLDAFQSNSDFNRKNSNHPEDTQVTKVRPKSTLPFKGEFARHCEILLLKNYKMGTEVTGEIKQLIKGFNTFYRSLEM
jgi:hypothetical protein